MKKLLIVVAVLAVGLVVYNVATTGEVKLIPSFGVSEEEQGVKDLENRFAAARREVAQAHRASAVSGIDSTSGAEAGRRSVDGIAKELAALRKGLSEDSAKRRAAGLADAIEEFQRKLR
jgi:hypothetical protein